MRGAGARGPGCEGRNTGPERGDRSLSPERESLLPKSALQIRHPKRGAECGGRPGSERETGVHRPEHGTGVRAGVRGSKCEADAGRNARSRGARTGVRARSARAVPPGTRGRSVGPEDEPGCVGRSARPGAGAGVRAGVRGRSAGVGVRARRARAAARIRRPKRGAECGGQVWVGARDRGTPPGTRDRSASRGAWVEVRGRRRAECEDRVVRAGTQGQNAGTGA